MFHWVKKGRRKGGCRESVMMLLGTFASVYKYALTCGGKCAGCKVFPTTHIQLYETRFHPVMHICMPAKKEG